MHDQVAAELAPFADGIRHRNLAAVESFFGDEYAPHFARYVVESGTLRPVAASHLFPQYVAVRFETLTRVLEAVAPALPPTEFIVYLGDGFASWSQGCPAPVFTFSKCEGDTAGVLIPDPTTLASSRKLRREVRAGGAAHPWGARASVAFWRGASTGGPFDLDNHAESARFRLVALSRTRPDLVDARFSSLCTCSPELEALVESRGDVAGFTRIAHHYRFKYLVLVDGFTSPWPRYFWGLHGDSALVKQESPHTGWFDRACKPWVHYVPLANDLRDLEERVSWAREHDDDVRAITARARQFALENLSDAAMLGYLHLLLRAYARLTLR